MLTATSTPSSPTISRPRARPSSRASVALSPPLHSQPSSPRCYRVSLSPPSSGLTTTAAASTALPAQPAAVDAWTQYSPLGYPPTSTRAAARAAHSLHASSESSSTSSSSFSGNGTNRHSNPRGGLRGEHLHRQHPQQQQQRQQQQPAKETTAATNSGSAGELAAPDPKPAHDAAAAASSGGTAAVAAAAPPTASSSLSSSSSSSSSSVRSALPSSPERSRLQMDGPAKVMPLKYETCDVSDLGVLISDMLNELVRLNDDIPLKDGKLTRFHSRAPPGISVKDYLSRLIVHATLSPPILLSMVYYIDRLCALYPAFTISSLTVHRFLITAGTVAAKGLGDSFWTNSTYARVGGVSVRELALLELEFLGRLEWRIVPKPEVLVDYYKSLVERSGAYELEKEQAVSADGEGMDVVAEGT